MEPTSFLFIFSTLCIIFQGETDCNYSWVQVHDRHTFEGYYSYWKSQDSQTPPRDIHAVGAFTVITEDREPRVYFHDTSMTVLLHEIDHLNCYAQYKQDPTFDHLACHFKLDEDIWGEPPQEKFVKMPKYSEKMAHYMKFIRGEV